MKPTSLVLSGWGPYRGMEQADFETMQQGLFLVSGPTGSGKTTIFDGITFALTGRSAEASGRRTVSEVTLRTLPLLLL